MENQIIYKANDISDLKPINEAWIGNKYNHYHFEHKFQTKTDVKNFYIYDYVFRETNERICEPENPYYEYYGRVIANEENTNDEDYGYFLLRKGLLLEYNPVWIESKGWKIVEDRYLFAINKELYSSFMKEIATEFTKIYDKDFEKINICKVINRYYNIFITKGKALDENITKKLFEKNNNLNFSIVG